MTETLEYYIKQVHKKGFNISLMINTYKKRQRARKSTYEVPEEVYIEVCKEYFKRGEEIDKGFPYFMKVLTMKAQDSCARKSQKHEKFGKMPENIRSIMGGMK